MHLYTERLLIRNFQADDWEAVLAYTSDSEVMKYIPEGVFCEQNVRAFIYENSGGKAEKFPVILKQDHTLIGHIVFHKWSGNGTYEIGWVFNPKYYSQGYASEAARAILQYGFEHLNAHRIIATCQPQNIASYRVMEKIGMRKEGHFKQCIPAHFIKGNTEWWDEYFYAILAEEWKRQNDQ
ncbi:GNAT family N-acetyltransferase [Paenibacillus protaetiae]|uniref:N-acetyltransferase n=1 Tax=Paenibacillus protaetiae TaxID=2509456 RepID=A0A4P6ETK0_9BACL|nr:GNAT family protein [Paenibacillus protaetiae]QAY66510.1 N-acetyltransferase [Paenibacillus protaetiae]